MQNDMKFEIDENTIGTEEASKILGCTPQNVRLILRNPKKRTLLGGVMIGRDWFVDKKKVLKYKIRKYSKKIT